MNLKLAAAAVLISLYLIYRTHRKQEALKKFTKKHNIQFDRSSPA